MLIRSALSLWHCVKILLDRQQTADNIQIQRNN